MQFLGWISVASIHRKKPSLLIDVLLDDVLDQVGEIGEDSKDLTFQSYPPTSVEVRS